MEKQAGHTSKKACGNKLLAARDAMDILSGKWKIPIMGAMMRSPEPMRFMDLKRALNGITPKVLSHNLQDLEINGLVSREVKDTKPITVEYQITEYGKTLGNVIESIIIWGEMHRKRILQ
ncbi:MAG: helix-turn-helix domain-containing protein [Bacteroidota bacterium]